MMTRSLPSNLSAAEIDTLDDMFTEPGIMIVEAIDQSGNVLNPLGTLMVTADNKEETVNGVLKMIAQVHPDALVRFKKEQALLAEITEREEIEIPMQNIRVVIIWLKLMHY